MNIAFAFRHGCLMGAAVLFALGLTALARAQNLQRVSTSLTDTLQSAVDLLPEGVNNIKIGAGPVFGSAFEGSKDYSIRAVPVISLKYRDWVEVVNNEIKIKAFDRIVTANVNGGGGSSLRAGPLVSINFGRGASDSGALRGMGDVGTSFELGAYVAYSMKDSRIRLRGRQDVAGGHKGATAQLDFTQTFLRGPRVSLSGTVAGEWASGPYMRSFFGVNPTQAAASGLPVFRAGAGLKDLSAGLTANYLLSDHWSIAAATAYERLIGDAAASPLIKQRGDPNQVSVSAFVIYAF